MWRLRRSSAWARTLRRCLVFSALQPLYAVELRNPLLTQRFLRKLRETGARLTIGVHAHMPAAARQSAALRGLDATDDEGDDWRMKGPLVVRSTCIPAFATTTRRTAMRRSMG